MAFEGSGEAGVEAEVSEKRWPPTRADASKAALKSAVKQAVDQAVVKLGATDAERRRRARSRPKKKALSGGCPRAPDLQGPVPVVGVVLLACDCAPCSQSKLHCSARSVALAAGLIGYILWLRTRTRVVARAAG